MAVLIVRTVSLPTVSLTGSLSASVWPRCYKMFWGHGTSLCYHKILCDDWSERGVGLTQHDPSHSPPAQRFDSCMTPPFFFFDVNNILRPPQTLQRALLPTATSAPTWDYEAQSENLDNPQLEELHWRNNKEITKDHLNKRATQVLKVERVLVCWNGFVSRVFDGKVVSVEHKLLAVLTMLFLTSQD